jgi:hypothetical protein
MDQEMFRFVWMSALVVGTLVIASIGGNITGYSVQNSEFLTTTSDYSKYSVSELMQQLPVDRYVSVEGEVGEILSDYYSKKGYEYQQFYLTDGSEDVLIFCSKYKGEFDVKKDDKLVINGKFQKYYNTYEIYLYCSDIEKAA